MKLSDYLDKADAANEKMAEKFKPIPAGKYDVVAESVDFKMTSTGKPMFTVAYTVEGGPQDGRRAGWDNMVLSPENDTALAIFYRTLDTLGVGREFLETDPEPESVCQKITGAKVKARVIISEWQGRDRNEVKSVFPRDGASGGGKPFANGGESKPSESSGAPKPPFG